MKMSRNGIVTSGRRPARPDGTYYREARKRGSGGRRQRRRSGPLMVVLVVIFAVVALAWAL